MIFIGHPGINDAIKNHLNGLKKTIKKKINKTRSEPLQKFLKSNLDEILIGHPKALIIINKEYSDVFEKTKNEKLKNESKIKRIFDYDGFTIKTTLKYCAFHLAKNINIEVCPYCNRNYTITVLDKGEWLMRPEFDHYFCKSEYPLLALSFHNLIPCCHICNCTFKKTIKFNLKKYLHPYVDNYVSNYRFTVLPKNYVGIIGNLDSFKIKIKLSGSGKNKIRNTISVFKVVKLYNSHKSIIRDMLKVVQATNGRYLDILAKSFQNNGVNISKSELYSLAFSSEYYECDFYKKPFSKLKKDILLENKVV